MLVHVLTSFVLLNVALTVSGLRCWKCENQDLLGCKIWGFVETCRPGVMESCQTEVRFFEHKKVIIRTGCKQGSACVDNHVQNPGAAWAPTQCNDGTRNSVCRCCCDGNMCNRRNLNLLCEFPKVEAKDAPVTESPLVVEKSCGVYPAEPENGKRSCIGGYAHRAFCKFTCNEGYKMVGGDMTVCVQRGSDLMWNRGAPYCERKDLCKPQPSTPKNGRVRCDGDGQVGTTCKFSCDYGYELDGPLDTECVKTEGDPVWNRDSPKCKRIVCNPMPTVPDNGERSCDGDGELGSDCYFTCDYGYERSGPSKTTCRKLVGRKGAEWSHDTPVCNKLVCSYLPRDPINGIKECSDRTNLDSVCSFACNVGFELDGSPSTTCEKTVFGMRWSHRVPRCKPVCKTLPDDPENGFKTCNGDGDLGTVCRFDCNQGHEMRGSSATICQLVEGGAADWSHETPRCEPVCKPLPEAPEHGRKKCDGAGEVGTICDFVCNPGYRLQGTPQIVCEEIVGGADWSDEMPTCKPFCDTFPRDPINGEKYCTGNGEVGTTCNFECHRGFRLDGAYQTYCEIIGDVPGWTEDTPQCTPVCTGMPRAPVNGSVKCSGTGEVGTECTFECDGYGFVLEGDKKVTCDEGTSRPRWSNEEPRCSVRPMCPNLGRMPFGDISCSNNLGYEEGTVCHFECLEMGYTLVPQERQTLTCRLSGANLLWSARKPCCVDCSATKRDIVIAMDSSGSIDPREWRDMTKFVQNLVRKFKVSSEAVQFSIFQFSSAPKSDGFMYFGRYSKPQLIRQIGRMRRIGSGTMTGLALKYAQRRLRDRGNRKDVPDMILMLTDGRAEDNDVLWKASRELREDGVELIALAIGPSDDFVQQMTRMTGKRENVLEAGRISDLTDHLADLLFKKTCQDERECLQYT